MAPEGGVSKELISAQMRAVPAETAAPEAALPELLKAFDPLFKEAVGAPLFRPHVGLEGLLRTMGRFRALEAGGVFGLAKDLMRVIGDRIDIGPLQKAAPPPPKERWGSLKSLEKYLATIMPAEKAHNMMGPLFGAYELRVADAHLPSDKLAEPFGLVCIDPKAKPLDQGLALMTAVADALWNIGHAVHNHIEAKKKDDPKAARSR